MWYHKKCGKSVHQDRMFSYAAGGRHLTASVPTAGTKQEISKALQSSTLMPKHKATLPSGQQISLDARPDRLDLRDRLYVPRLRNLPSQFPDASFISTHFPAYKKLVLNQGTSGACTGFGLAACINFLSFHREIANYQTCSVKQVSSSTKTREDLGHGSFDNDIKVIGSPLEIIRGKALKQPVTDLRC
jgi:hypothetical protein